MKIKSKRKQKKKSSSAELKHSVSLQLYKRPRSPEASETAATPCANLCDVCLVEWQFLMLCDKRLVKLQLLIFPFAVGFFKNICLYEKYTRKVIHYVFYIAR